MGTHSASDDAASSTSGAAQSSDAAGADVEAVDGEDAAVNQATDGGDANEDTDANGDETVPHVELDLYQLSVRVSGQSTDSLDDVEASAKGLMEFLIQEAKQLEDDPDTRGLS
ncbi:hypothetical protein [Haloferax sp. DFSO60]|uniref:hypothetical protein n=1 Tax=Haloferax sp. DFSO60 TaxID=3388652 RepID=UPI00397D3722